MYPSVPYITKNQIRLLAEDFLSKYNPFNQLPVPIEEIIEVDLGLEIRPFRGLKERFAIEGYISNDLATIFVDDSLLKRHLINRYRFTLAHEVAHYVLHQDFIKAAYPDDEEEWKTLIQDLPAKARGGLEFQAYEFAGCLLVPRTALADAWEEARLLALKRDLDIDAMGESGIEVIAGWIAKQLQVSTQVVFRCLTRDEFTTANRG